MSSPAPAAAREAPLERALRDFDTLGAELPDEVVARALRRRAAEQLRRLGWPQARDEQWRYTNLRALERIASFAPLAAPPEAAARGVDSLPDPIAGFERWLFVDGVRHAAPRAAARGGVALPFPGAADSWSAGQRLGLLNDMFARDAAVLRISGEAAVELLFLSSAGAAGAALYPRVHVELSPGSRLQLIERHLSAAPAPHSAVAGAAGSFVNTATTIELGGGAQLMHYRLQQCGPQTLFLDTLSARLQEQARYEVRHLAMGAAGARTSARVRLAARGAAVGWQAIAIGHAEQVHDTTLEVEHAAAATRTDEVFRGIAEERARLAFSAHIHVQSSAPGAEARQSLRGLIEGAGAEIDLRPRLQIDTDEVSAQHGATTGRLDEQLLFYLLARGLDRRTARSLLKWAFLGDVLRAIELPALRAQVEQSAAGQLQDVLAVGALPSGAGAAR